MSDFNLREAVQVALLGEEMHALWMVREAWYIVLPEHEREEIRRAYPTLARSLDNLGPPRVYGSRTCKSKSPVQYDTKNLPRGADGYEG